MTNLIPWRQMRKDVATPSKNSYVYKLGFKYAIVWYNRSYPIEQHLSEKFGPPNKTWHYHTYRGYIKIKPNYSENRWFCDSQRWNDRSESGLRWAVFKSEKDLTLALLCL